MDPRRWLNIAELYQTALPLGPSERNAFLDKSCVSDTVLREELNSLLEAEETSGKFLEEPLFELGLKLLVDSDARSEPVEQKGVDNFIGTVVDDRYEVVEKLGSGGIGDVYKARDKKILLRAVVIKVLKDSSLTRPWVVAKFQQEIAALTRIADAGVVGVIDAGASANGKPYLVMEFVEGCNLREFMQRREAANTPIAFYEAADILKQVGRTLTSAHQAGVIHRDLKPANIMVRKNASGDLQVKVIDFGIAKLLNAGIADTTTTGLMAGTLSYMAPEQLDNGKVTPASDVYSLGLIAYEIVTGSKPFNPESAVMLLALQRAGVKVLPKDLRPGLPLMAQVAILKALTYESSGRYQRARDFGDAVAHALTQDDAVVSVGSDVSDSIAASTHHSERISSHSSSQTSSVSRRPWRGHLVTRLLLGAVVVSALLGLTYAWYGTPSPSVVRTLTYSLTVQKKGAQETVQSTGNEKFKTGDRFRLNVFSSESGYLYVLNEGAEDGGGTVFTFIYPTPNTNKGSAKLESPIIQTSWNTFQGPPDKEEFWLIWSNSPISQLEETKKAAFNADEGRISNAASVRRVRDFLLKRTDPNLDIFNNLATKQIELKATSDPLIRLVELEHQ